MRKKTNTQKAKVHADRMYYCTCGATPRGNGGRSSHRLMHERKGDGHREITLAQWRAQQEGGR